VYTGGNGCHYLDLDRMLKATQAELNDALEEIYIANAAYNRIFIETLLRSSIHQDAHEGWQERADIMDESGESTSMILHRIDVDMNSKISLEDMESQISELADFFEIFEPSEK